MLENDYNNISIRSLGTWVLISAIVLGLLGGYIGRGMAEAWGIFVFLLISAVLVGIAQQTLP